MTQKQLKIGTVIVWVTDNLNNPCFGEIVRYTKRKVPLVVPLPFIIDDVESYPGWNICSIYPFVGAGYLEKAKLCPWSDRSQTYLYEGKPTQLYDENTIYKFHKIT